MLLSAFICWWSSTPNTLQFSVKKRFKWLLWQPYLSTFCEKFDTFFAVKHTSRFVLFNMCANGINCKQHNRFSFVILYSWIRVFQHVCKRQKAYRSYMQRSNMQHMSLACRNVSWQANFDIRATCWGCATMQGLVWYYGNYCSDKMSNLIMNVYILQIFRTLSLSRLILNKSI